MRLAGWSAVLVVVAAGCGSDDEGTCEVEGGKSCFEPPTAALVAWKAGESLAPNLTCAKPEPTAAAQNVMISGTLKQYTSSAALPGITLDAYSTIDLTTLVFTASTGSDGAFTATIPSGSPNILHIKATGTGLLPALALYQKFDVSMPTAPSVEYRGPTQALLDVVTTTTRVELSPARTTIAAVVQDCDGNDLEHAIVTVSSTAHTATHVDGVNVFYGAAGDLPLPIQRSEQSDTNNNGAAALLNVPATGNVHVQAWGFVAASDVSKGTSGLTLLADWESPTIVGGVVAVPLRSSASP